MGNGNTRVWENTVQKKEPYKKEPSNNPPPSVPHEKPKKSAPKEISLRSEEEEKVLEEKLQETILSPKDKRRLINSEHSTEKILEALELIKTQTVKKSFMGLLLQMLNNPDMWNETSKGISSSEQKALQYNELLAKLSSPLAKENEESIQKGFMKVILDGNVEQLSLNSKLFEKDIRQALKELKFNGK